MPIPTFWSMICGVFVSLFIGVSYAADIVVAQSAPLTGDAAGTGNGLVLGAKVYFDHVNSAEGGIKGQKILHLVKDDAHKVEETVKNTKEFIANPAVVSLIGYAGTDNVMALFKQGLFDATPLSIVGVSTGARLLREPHNPTIFHIRASFAEEIEEIVRHVAGLGTKRIAVFYEENPFGEAGLRAAEDAVKKRNLILVARASYEPLTVDVRNAVQDVMASKPDAVIMVAITPPAAEFTKQFRAAGGFASIFNVSTANAEGLVKAVGPAVMQGLGISQVLPFPHSAALPVVSEYQALMAKYAPGAPYSYASMEGFINAKILVEGLKRAGKNPTRASVKKALESLGEFNTGGYSVTFNPNKHVGSKFVELTVISKSGALRR